MRDNASDSTLPPKPVAASESPTVPPSADRSQTQAYAGASPAGADLAAGSVPQLPVTLGRYQLRKLLGKGGMGAVYLAHDTLLDRPVALKIPSFANAASTARERFVQEARAAATLAHPNLCPVYDAGTIDGVEYLTMAFIEGKPLTALIRGGRPLPEKTAAVLVRQLALAMQAAHDKGIIHRDLKPDNIMITPKKQPVIMDFGLARRSVSPTEARLTQAGFFMGTPAYMSPEQVNGDVKTMGPGCDIYSLGVVLYQLLTGRLPFDPASGVSALIQIVCDPPPPPRQFRPDLSPELEAICLKTLAKKPEDRPRSMTDLAKSLEGFVRGQGGGTSAGGVDPAKLVFAQMLAGDTEIAPRPASVPRPAPPRRWPWLAGAGAVALLSLVLAVVLSGQKDGAAELAVGLKPHPPVSIATPETPPKQGTDHDEPAKKAPDQGAGEKILPKAAASGPSEKSSDNGAKKPVEKPPVQPVTKVPPPSQPLPVPAASEVQKARDGIRQMYADRYARQARAVWLTLSQRLRGQAEAMLDDALHRYALWQEARQLAIQAAAPGLALRISDELSRAFTLDGLELKIAAIRAINGVLTAPGPAYPAGERPELNHRLAASALEVMDAACLAHKFETAFDLLEICSLAEDRARQDRDVVLFETAPGALKAIKPQFLQLQRDPEDAAANLQVGRFLCLSEGRWHTGLPLLGKASDPLWQAAAKCDLSHPTDAPAHVAAGDTWKRLFDRDRSRERGRLARHARGWYDLALSELLPAERHGVVSRVLQIGGAPNLNRVKPFFDGDTADPGSGFPEHRAEPNYEWDSGYAKGRWFMRVSFGYWFGTYITRIAPPFACQVSARIVDPPLAAWDLIFANPDQKHLYKGMALT
jgi:predicted Ser/Thr protein kinase